MSRYFRRPSPLRIVYWIVMLAAIGFVLWKIQSMLAPYNAPSP
jgi:hypothetical protein